MFDVFERRPQESGALSPLPPEPRNVKIMRNTHVERGIVRVGLLLPRGTDPPNTENEIVQSFCAPNPDQNQRLSAD